MKVLVIGLDGASPWLLDRWIKELPTFRSFKEEGLWGVSIPPVPAQTPVAWTTFMTGKNPGKHGIFSFAMRKPGTYDRRIINPSMIRSKTLWRILSERAHARVGVLNVPMADFEEVNGFMIPGFLSSLEGVPSPPEVKRKLEKKFGAIERVAGDVETDVLKKVKSDPYSFFARVDEITDNLAEVGLFLLEEEKWDFFMTVFMGTDRIQHFFWSYLDEKHPEYVDGEFTVKSKQFYMKMDRIIARFLDAAPKDTLTILLSDHGFCPVWKSVILNNYLQEHGLLKTKAGKIDLEKSKAVSYGYGDIWLNVKGREPKGGLQQGREYEETRKEIIRLLENLQIDGSNPIKKVKKREEVYWGSRIDEGPDLMVFFNYGWQAARRPEITGERADKRYVNDAPMWSGGHDGTHDPEDVPGFLAIKGPSVGENRAVRANLYDLAPTVLSVFGVPVPKDMDGTPIPVLSGRSERKSGFRGLFRR
jgi:predicted AlkP superfamily phosphohydrolase/phosphomutase